MALMTTPVMIEVIGELNINKLDLKNDIPNIRIIEKIKAIRGLIKIFRGILKKITCSKLSLRDLLFMSLR